MSWIYFVQLWAIVPNDIFNVKAFDVWTSKSLSKIDIVPEAVVNDFDIPSKVKMIRLFGEAQVVLALNLTKILWWLSPRFFK